MKKTIILATTLVIALVFGSAFAADSKAAPESKRLYNGITFFDTGPETSTRTEAAVTAETVPEKKPFNGITYFDLGQPKSSSKGYAAGGPGAQEKPDKKPYNGITVF